MSVVGPVFLLGFGLALLTKGADWLVSGGAALAKRFRISSLVVGLTVIAFGTSVPELVVSVMAALKGSGDIALGNVVGSNIANIGLILGISAIVYPLAIHSSTVWKEIPLALAAAFLMLLLASDATVTGGFEGALTFRDGCVLLIFFVVFLYYIFSMGLNAREKGGADKITPVNILRTHTIVLLICSGLAALAFGGKLVVDQSIVLSRLFGVDESLIGSTIVAVGTSLPELFTSVAAAIKRETDIAVGNIVGSNIFNSLFVIGTAAILAPVSASRDLMADSIFMIAVTFGLWILCGHRHRLSRTKGIILLVAYSAYIFALLGRQGII